MVGPWVTTSPPRARTAATLLAGADSGTTMTAVAPTNRAPKQTDWAWFPVDAVTIPAARSSAVRARARLMPPRTLKAPVGWTFSCLTTTDTPAASSSSGYDHAGVGG